MERKKKVFSKILGVAAMLGFVGNVYALEVNSDIVNDLPDTVSFSVTEKAAVVDNYFEEIETKENEIQNDLEAKGYDFTGYEIDISFKELNNPKDPDGMLLPFDIHNIEISVYTNVPEDPTKNNIKMFSKDAKATYSNSSSYNAEDAEYVKNKIAPVWFHRYSTVELGTDEEHKKVEDDYSSLFNDSSITFVLTPNGMAGNYLSDYCGYTISFFKNDVLYAIKEGSYTTYSTITIPNETKENTESYINYALPKLKDYLKPDMDEGAFNDVTLKGQILAEKDETTSETSTEYDTYYEVKNDGSINPISAEEDETVVTATFGSAYFSMFFDIMLDGEVAGQIILLKPNVLVVDKNILVNSKLTDGSNVTVSKVEEDVLKQMTDHLNSLGMKDILSSYELKLEGSTDGNITITFALGTEYNGKDVYILHKKQDDSYENFVETVKEGSITITVSELSPFVIALNNEKVADNTEDERKLDGEPKTGIEANNHNAISYAILVISILGLLKIKKFN